MSDETRARVATLATSKATELNWPWDPNALTIKPPPLGLAGVWRVSSYYEPDNATATLIVNETRERCCRMASCTASPALPKWIGPSSRGECRSAWRARRSRM